MADLPNMVDPDDDKAPAVSVPGEDAPVKIIKPRDLRQLGRHLASLYNLYRSDRLMQEQRWMRNLRQYLGYYDPEVEKFLTGDRSRAYPKITRTKCISMLSRVMDLMFPSDDSNWTLEARPSPDMDIADVKAAVAAAVARDTDPSNPGNGPQVDDAYIQAAVLELAQQRAADLTKLITDQLQELGGDQSYDYIALNKEVVASSILYGAGVLLGPYARKVETSSWVMDLKTNQPKAKKKTTYMPHFEFLRVWDYYPDMSAKRLEDGDGYFVRKVLAKKQVRDLAKREDFFSETILSFLKMHDQGNYKAEAFEQDLRAIGVKAVVNEQKPETAKYEVLIWHGPINGADLALAGVEVPEDKMADQIDAEVWMMGDHVIKAVMNPWAELGVDVSTAHAFVFDRDDTSPVGFGLPNVMRDSQMTVSAATRMMLDNASVVCGPILEVNKSLMAADQDISTIHAYKTYYRDDEGQTAQFPAVREVKVDAHIDELEKIIQLFLGFADTETFVSPANGGDMSKMPSEPMRNAAGASMMLGNAALPFKDIIRNFDRFTQSVIQSLVAFNREFNPTVVKVSDYSVIARGATSLIAKEMRAMQIDQLVTSLTPEEKIHVDIRKVVEQRFKVRDLEGMLVSEAEAKRKQAAADAGTAQQAQLAQQLGEANVRLALSNAFKNIAQGQKNMATADVEKINAALDVLERGDQSALTHAQTVGTHADTASKLAGLMGGGAASPDAPGPGDPNAPAGDDGGAAQGSGGASAPPDQGGPGPAQGSDPGAAPALGDPSNPGAGLVPPGGAAPGAGGGPGL